MAGSGFDSLRPLFKPIKGTMSDSFHDLETFSPIPLKDGTHKYSEGVEIMVWAWAVEDGPVLVWDIVNRYLHWQDELSGLWEAKAIKGNTPDELQQVLLDSDMLVWFHNGGMFDFVMLDRTMPALAQLITPERRRDTMVQAFAHGLPGALEKLGHALNITESERKHKEGKRLVQLFCKPQNEDFVKKFGTNRASKKTHPAEWQRFIEYAGGDITTMRAAHKKMPMWNYRSKQIDLWLTDLTINSRGFQIDMEMVAAAISSSDRAKALLAKRTQVLTDDVVQSANQRDELLKFILEIHGVELPDMQADTLERRMDDPDLPDAVKELIGIRLQASMNSVAKYKTLQRGVSSDGRLRGGAQFRGAARTGRWGHRLFQHGNMPRPSLPDALTDVGIDAMKLGVAELVVDDVMELCRSAVRKAIVAPRGKKLIVLDYSNIEGRYAAWLAHEDWKLEAFRQFDAGIGYDLYILAYAKSFNVEPEVVGKKSPERQIGKVEELMFQYGGGVGAWITGAATYGIHLDKMTEAVWPTLPEWAVKEANSFLQWLYEEANARAEKRTSKGVPLAEVEEKRAAEMLKARLGLTEQVFIACDAIKRLWRKAHPAISSWWASKDEEHASLEATLRKAYYTPGEVFESRRVKFRRDGGWMRIGMPSGRALCYPSIKIDEKNGSITYAGFNQYTRQWGRVGTYGGKLCIAAGTLVLTAHRGWIPIEEVTSVDRVWDGVTGWVPTRGAVAKGRKEVVKAYGAWMTHDHEVLTTEGWKHASQSARHNRAYCRLPAGVEVPQQQRAAVSVVGGVRRLRREVGDGRERVSKAGRSRAPLVMRVHAQADDRGGQHQARDVSTSGVRSLAQHGRSLSVTDASGVGELWRAWHQGVRALVKVVQQLLGRHGADVPTGSDDRAQRQQPWVQSEELRVGDVQAASRQSARQYAEVFDLMDCGPLNRFTIAAGSAPLVVHNCENITQGIACDQLAEPMLELERAGYPIVFHVHDEIVMETPDTDEYNLETASEIMCRDLGWNRGVPLAVAGFETDRYRKE